MKIANPTDHLEHPVSNIPVDPVTSLINPTDATQKGITRYMQEKLRVWDGSDWQTWVTPHWAYETVELTTVNQETDSLLVTTTSLVEDRNIALTYSYSSTKDTLGTIKYIGANSTLDFDLVNGNMVSVTAADGCWFHVGNQAGTPPTNHKDIYTMTGNDVHYLKKALFVYKADIDKFLLIDYDRHIWDDNISIGESAFLPVGSNNFDRSVVFDGVYLISLFLRTEEYENDQVTAANTQLQQKLHIGTPATIEQVDESGHMIADQLADYKWFNHSLQGTAVVEVDAGQIRYTTDLPNGDFGKVLGGNMYLKFLKEL